MLMLNRFNGLGAFQDSEGGGGATDPYFANVALLLHMNGTDGSTTFTDSGPNTVSVTANDGAQIDTAIKKYGTGSGLFDGTNDYISWPNDSSFPFGTDPYTIEFWMYSTVANNDKFIINARTGIGGGLIVTTGGFGGTTAGVIRVAHDGTVLLLSTTVLDDSAWHHVAIVRESTSSNAFKLYIDGNLEATGTDNANYTGTTGTWYMSRNNSSGNYIAAQFDDVRITNGVARYTSNFTPPTSEFPDS